MMESAEQRFGACTRKKPYSVQWLSDNGPPYIADETRGFGRQLGLVICNTPTHSPESNGLAEAFVKNFNRDQVYLPRLETAERF